MNSAMRLHLTPSSRRAHQSRFSAVSRGRHPPRCRGGHTARSISPFFNRIIRAYYHHHPMISAIHGAQTWTKNASEFRNCRRISSGLSLWSRNLFGAHAHPLPLAVVPPPAKQDDHSRRHGPVQLSPGASEKQPDERLLSPPSRDGWMDGGSGCGRFRVMR